MALSATSSAAPLLSVRLAGRALRPVPILGWPGNQSHSPSRANATSAERA